MNTEKTITITKEDFDRAVMVTMINGLHDPHFEGHQDAAMMYSLGGMAFAREVRHIIFGEEEHDDQ